MSTDQNETVIQHAFNIGKLKQQHNTLLKALRKIAEETSDEIAERDARAAIAAVEEEKKE